MTHWKACHNKECKQLAKRIAATAMTDEEQKALALGNYRATWEGVEESYNADFITYHRKLAAVCWTTRGVHEMLAEFHIGCVVQWARAEAKCGKGQAGKEAAAKMVIRALQDLPWPLDSRTSKDTMRMMSRMDALITLPKLGRCRDAANLFRHYSSAYFNNAYDIVQWEIQQMRLRAFLDWGNLAPDDDEKRFSFDEVKALAPHVLMMAKRLVEADKGSNKKMGGGGARPFTTRKISGFKSQVGSSL